MEPGRDDQLKFAKHFERAQGWLLLENYAAAERALRQIPAAFRERTGGVRANNEMSPGGRSENARALRSVGKEFNHGKFALGTLLRARSFLALSGATGGLIYGKQNTRPHR